MAGMACPLFEAGTPKSTSDSVITSITTEVRRARGILQRHSCKYSSQSFLDPTVIVLWLIPAWVLGRNRLAAMQSLIHMTSFSIQKYHDRLDSEIMHRELYNRIWHIGSYCHRMSRLLNQNLELLCSQKQCDFPRLGPAAWFSKGMRGMRNLGSSPPL